MSKIKTQSDKKKKKKKKTEEEEKEEVFRMHLDDLWCLLKDFQFHDLLIRDF